MKPSEILTREELAPYTPGPWSWDGIPPRYYRDGDWENVAPWLNSDSTDDAVVTGEICCPNRANLRLIAAAPELYEALKLINDALYIDENTGEWRLPASLDTSFIDAALAKAEGTDETK